MKKVQALSLPVWGKESRVYEVPDGWEVLSATWEPYTGSMCPSMQGTWQVVIVQDIP